MILSFHWYFYTSLENSYGTPTPPHGISPVLLSPGGVIPSLSLKQLLHKRHVTYHIFKWSKVFGHQTSVTFWSIVGTSLVFESYRPSVLLFPTHLARVSSTRYLTIPNPLPVSFVKRLIVCSAYLWSHNSLTNCRPTVHRTSFVQSLCRYIFIYSLLCRRTKGGWQTKGN